MDNALLTIIIPFLNEKDEVENTLKSIREHSKENDIKIILIDDSSDDGMDYECVAIKYHTIYIKNRERLGVAASRDLGVNHSETPYVMFLDAHMRFYDTMWSHRIIGELSKDDKALLCCQSKGFINTEKSIVEVKGRPNSYGAYIDFDDMEQLIEPKWIFTEDPNPNVQTISIPCVLGAAYACTKSFWIYLRGLNGLQYYGSDEPYISMKVWLSGGKCKLLKDVVVGHFYRNEFPYDVPTVYRWYNRLLITELLLPSLKRSQIFSYVNLVERKAFLEFYKNRELIYSLKNYYAKIFTHNFSYFNKINTYNIKQRDNNTLLEEIAQYVILNCNLLSNDGIMNGKMGIVLFLFHYGRYSKKSAYTKFAYTILDDILNRLNMHIPLNIENGITGIGWGIAYLYSHSFLNGDPDTVFKELDENIRIKTMQNEAMSYSELLGVILYVMARLSITKKYKTEEIFTSKLLDILYNKAQTIILQNKEIDNLRVLIHYCTYYEGLTQISKPSIYDLIYLRMPKQYNYKRFALGLDGNSGIGLKLILDEVINI